VFREEAGMTQALDTVRELRERYRNDLTIDDRGKVWNTDLYEAWELGCLLDIAEVTAMSAINRTESRGGHSREDFKERDDQNWLVHSLAHRASEDVAPKSDVAIEINVKKKVDMSLAAEDERFVPKVRSY
jgi:succinate dehydrogenase / fumarate reductase flavoprotein subunit